MQKYVHIYDEALKPLCNAIMAQAIKDYTTDPDSKEGREAKSFILSEWFFQLSDGMDGQAILNKLDRKMKEFQELCGKHVPKIWKDTKEAAACQFSCPFCNNKVKIQWNGGHSNYNGNKRGGILTYTHQCEGCGVRQTYAFKGIVPEIIEKNKTCRNCAYYKPTLTRSATCLKHKTNTTRSSCCGEWKEKGT